MNDTEDPRRDDGESPVMSRRAMLAGLLLFVLAFAFAAAVAQAGEAPVIAADEAARREAAGTLTVIDVRSPQEWHKTGVPKGARHVSIHDPGGLAAFVAKVKKAMGGSLDKPLAVICATGTRSTIAAKALDKAGFTHVLNIREGMFGSTYGKGWLARGLPVESCASC